MAEHPIILENALNESRKQTIYALIQCIFSIFAKEIIYIVAPRALRDGIMRAVMEKAGKDTSAHGIVFSLPVESVLGISGYEA